MDEKFPFEVHSHEKLWNNCWKFLSNLRKKTHKFSMKPIFVREKIYRRRWIENIFFCYFRRELKQKEEKLLLFFRNGVSRIKRKLKYGMEMEKLFKWKALECLEFTFCHLKKDFLYPQMQLEHFAMDNLTHLCIHHGYTGSLLSLVI